MNIRFWPPNLSRSVKEYWNDVLNCAKSKPRREPKAPLQPIPSGYPMQWLHIDIVGPLPWTKRGSQIMLTVQCSLTKWAKACAMLNQWVSAVTVFQERCISQDPQLTNPKEMDRSRIYMLTARTEEQSGAWDEELDFCMMAYWSSVHSSTGHTPFELVYSGDIKFL